MEESLLKSQEKKQNYISFAKILIRVMIISFGSLFFGYQIGVLSLAQDTIWEVFGIPSSQQDLFSSLLSASVPFGAMIGSSSSGLIQDYLSRKKSFYLADIVGIGATCLSQVNNIYTFLFSRILSGIIVGLNSSLVPQYIQEISPQSIGGIMGTVFAMFINTGIVIASFLGQFFDENPVSSDKYWRFVFLFPLILTAGRMILIILFYNEETPYYYISKGNIEGCKKFIESMYLSEYRQEILENVQKQVQKDSQSKQGYKDVFKPLYLRKLMVGASLQFFQQFSGINAVIMYSSQIFKKNDYSFFVTNLLSLISNIVLLIAAFGSGFFVNSLGRKPILIYGSILCGVFHVCLSILSFVNDTSIAILSVVFIFLYYFAFNFSLGPMVWVYCSEILPPKGISLATLVNWTSGTIIVFALPYFDLSYLFAFYAIICFLSGAFSMFILIETKGKSKMEIRQMYLPPGDNQNPSTLSNEGPQYE